MIGKLTLVLIALVSFSGCYTASGKPYQVKYSTYHRHEHHSHCDHYNTETERSSHGYSHQH